MFTNSQHDRPGEAEIEGSRPAGHFTSGTDPGWHAPQRSGPRAATSHLARAARTWG